VHRVGEVAVARDSLRNDQLAFSRAARDRGSAGVALQRVRRGELLEVVAELSGDSAGQTGTESGEAEVDLACRKGVGRVSVVGVRVGWAAEQQLAHLPLPYPALRGDEQQLGGQQADSVDLGRDQVGRGDEVVGIQCREHAVGELLDVAGTLGASELDELVAGDPREASAVGQRCSMRLAQSAERLVVRSGRLRRAKGAFSRWALRAGERNTRS